MTKEFILKKAMEQSAVDSHCLPERFLADENTVVVSEADPRARIYLELPFICDLTYYGSGIVASVSEPLTEKIKGFLTRYSAEHCFEPPAIYDLNGILSEYGAKVCYIAEYFLPDPIKMKEAESFCEPRAVCTLEILEKEDFVDLYRKEWGNALCSARKSSDEIAVAAYVDGEIAALAGASRDCEEMWQIGVDVRTEFRGLNLGCAVVHKLAAEILSRGKIPFYCAAWSNIRSVRTALKCGFFPAWVQLTAKIVEFVDNA